MSYAALNMVNNDKYALLDPKTLGDEVAPYSRISSRILCMGVRTLVRGFMLMGLGL